MMYHTDTFLARHVFGSIIGLHKAYATLDQERKLSFNVHLTMLDIQPTALARDLCILILLNDLMSAERGTELETEIKATLFYVYTAVLMPAYCHERYVHWLNSKYVLTFVVNLRLQIS